MVTPPLLTLFAAILQVDKLAPYMFIIFLDDVLRTSIDQIKGNGFTSKKKRQEPDVETIMDAVYAEAFALLINLFKLNIRYRTLSNQQSIRLYANAIKNIHMFKKIL